MINRDPLYRGGVIGISGPGDLPCGFAGMGGSMNKHCSNCAWWSMWDCVAPIPDIILPASLTIQRHRMRSDSGTNCPTWSGRSNLLPLKPFGQVTKARRRTKKKGVEVR